MDFIVFKGDIRFGVKPYIIWKGATICIEFDIRKVYNIIGSEIVQSFKGILFEYKVFLSK